MLLFHDQRCEKLCKSMDYMKHAADMYKKEKLRKKVYMSSSLTDPI